MPTPPAPHKPSQTTVPWNVVGPGLIAAAFGCMTWISWRRWPDLLIDFGQQLYVPWVISEGQVLYRDIVYFHGPLGSYVNAAVFALAGPGMLHLALFNLALVFCFALFLFHWVRQLSDAACATLAGLAFVLAFAFAYYWGVGLLNFICPYVYDLTYGFMLGCVALYQSYRYLSTRSRYRLVGIGLLLGLVFLTKAEMFLASLVAVGTALLLDARGRGDGLRLHAWRAALVIAGMALPAFAFFLYFSLKMPMGEAIYHLFSQWIHGLNPDIRGLFYYKFVSGTLFLEQNLIKIGVHLIVYASLLALLLALNRWLDQRGLNTPRTGLYCAVVLAVGLILLYTQIPWRHLPRSFPFILMAVCATLAYRYWRYTHRSPQRNETLSLLALAMFALVLTLKAILNLNISHVGFVLALPATLVILICLLHHIPRYLESKNHNAWIFRCGAYALAGVTVMVWTSFSYTQYQIKTYPVGQGADMIYDFPPNAIRFDGTPLDRALITQNALAFMQQEIGPGKTVLTLPDAMMINYLLRRKFPTRDTILNPLVWIIRGDASVLKSLEQSPPDYVVYVEADFSMFGGPVFGQEYARAVKDWIDARYTQVRQFGKPPFTAQGFGIQVLKRKKDATTSSLLRSR